MHARSTLAALVLSALPALAQSPAAAGPAQPGFAAPTTSQMRVGIFTKLQYDLEYFSGVLKQKAEGKRDTRVSKDEWDREVRRATNNVPVLKRLFVERPEHDAKGKSLSLPPRDDVHRVYSNLIALLNMLQAYDRGDFPKVLQMGERVVVSSKTDLGVVRSDDAKYYLNLYREYFWFMAAAHYRLGHDREAIAWLSRIDTDANVKELKAELAKVDTRSAAERLSVLYAKSLAVVPLVDLAPGAETAWLGAGFAEVFTTDLQRYTSLTVMERGNIDKVLREVQLSQAGLTEEKNAQKVAGLLAAGTLLRGTYKQEGAGVTLVLELVDGDTGRALGRAAGSAPKDALFAGAREVLLTLLRDVGWLSEDSANELRAARSPTAETIRSLLEARLLLASKSDQAKALYEKAMKSDPEYAKAFEDVQKQFAGVNPLVAVMSFVNVTGREDEQWMASGAAEALTTDLPGIGFTLVERTQLAKLLKEQMLGQVLDEKSASGLAQKLGADFVVLGSVMNTGRDTRVDCRFVDIGTSVVVQTFTATGPGDDFGKTLGRLSAEIARRFNVKLSEAELAKLAGNKLTRAEFERMAREKLMSERLVRETQKKEAQSSSRAPAFVAGAGVLVGAGAAVTGFLMASQSSANTAYIEGLQNFATRPEDVANLEAQRTSSLTTTTVWTAVGIGGVVVAAGSSAFLAWKVLSAEPGQGSVGVVAAGPVRFSPFVALAPGQVGLGASGRF